MPFLSKASQKDRGIIEKRICEQLLKTNIASDVVYLSLPPLSTVDRQFLVERHLISREHAYGKGQRGVCIGAKETISIMVNEGPSEDPGPPLGAPGPRDLGAGG